MKQNDLTHAPVLRGFAYLRLSREEAQSGESGSISNQRSIIEAYCRQNGIELAGEFADDGWSGGNFERPGFREMLARLEDGGVNAVVTKDLSRLGRDMREASYYAEQYFPEHRIRYLAIADNFDSERDNSLAPFQFAMNEVYLRDGSRKVRAALKTMRENGKYCACPPFGYRKDPADRNRLIPDENTSPTVQRIFRMAAAGESTQKISQRFNEEGVLPPLKYRALYRDSFSEEGAARASDTWNPTTVKRILKNRVYLGHTVLGKTRKLSLRSDQKQTLPPEEWAVTPNTHEPLVSEELFRTAQVNLAKGTSDFREHADARISIFRGVVRCARCGHAMCSGGTVYGGEREKYWYLECTHTKRYLPDRCPGTRIRYRDLCEIVREDLNDLIALSEQERADLVESLMKERFGEREAEDRRAASEKLRSRLAVIDRMLVRLYSDNAEGKLSDERLYAMVESLEKEADGLTAALAEAEKPTDEEKTRESFEAFAALVEKHTHIEQLTREDVLTFIDRIEIGPAAPQEDTLDRNNASCRQEIRIFYRFIGPMETQDSSDLSPTV